MSPTSVSHHPLKPADFHILLVLATEDLHGYGIMQRVEEQSGGDVVLELGSLYRIMARLLDDGLIAETRAKGSPDPRRKYYTLTPRGRDVAAKEAERLARVMRLPETQRLLTGRVSG